MQVVVDGLILRRDLKKEVLRQIRNPRLRIANQLRDLTNLPLDLDHAVVDEMREDHERVLLHDDVVVAQPAVQVVVVLVDEVAEGDGDITEGDDDVAADVGVLRRLEDLEEKGEVGIAELRADTKELGERECGRGAQDFVLEHR